MVSSIHVVSVTYTKWVEFNIRLNLMRHMRWSDIADVLFLAVSYVPLIWRIYSFYCDSPQKLRGYMWLLQHSPCLEVQLRYYPCLLPQTQHLLVLVGLQVDQISGTSTNCTKKHQLHRKMRILPLESKLNGVVLLLPTGQSIKVIRRDITLKIFISSSN